MSNFGGFESFSQDYGQVEKHMGQDAYQANNRLLDSQTEHNKVVTEGNRQQIELHKLAAELSAEEHKVKLMLWQKAVTLFSTVNIFAAMFLFVLLVWSIVNLFD